MLDRKFINYLDENEIEEGIKVAKQENYNVQCYLEFLDHEKHQESSSFRMANAAI